MPEFKEGQRVKVEYEGAVVSFGGRSLQISTCGDRRYFNLDMVKVTVLDPPDWPPQVGDIWQYNYMEWFALATPSGVSLVPDDGNDPWDPVEFKTLNPVLVRRRGQ